MSDPTELRSEEFHPAARQAYRWLKGFMVASPADYSRCIIALSMAAAGENRQAEICMGTVERLRTGQPVSDRYLLGLCWTIMSMSNPGIESVADKRIDRAYGIADGEYKPYEEQHNEQ